MQAIILNGFGGTENFAYKEDVGIPEIGDLDVLIKISSAGFNPIDYQMRKGGKEAARIHSPILGREFSGIVERTGVFVKNFKMGDAVFAASGSMGSNGSYADYIAVPESILALKPDNISFEQAAALPVVYLTALQIYDRLSVIYDHDIFITGAAGGVGLALVKLLMNSGHKHVIATAGNKWSKQSLLDSGLAEKQIIDYRIENPESVAIDTNRGKYFDYCIDLVGGKMSELCAEVIKLNGSYADVTALSTEKARTLLFDKGAVNYNISNYAHSLFGKLEWYGQNLERIAGFIKKGLITPPTIKLFKGLSIDSVSQAHQILEENGTNGHKLVMQIR